MLANIKLYSIPLTTTDQLYFSTKNEQQEYFNNLSSSGDYVVSYNGLRDIRIEGNVFEDITKFSYAVLILYNANNEEVFRNYCFVNGIYFTNDTVYHIDLTIDYFQTFVIQNIDNFTYSPLMLSTKTIKSDNFSKYLPYSNKVDVSEYNFYRLNENLPTYNIKDTKRNLYINAYLGYFVVNIDENGLEGTRQTYVEKGFVYPFNTCLIPFFYNPTSKEIATTNDFTYTREYSGQTLTTTIATGISGLINILNSTSSSYIYNIGVKFETISNFNVNIVDYITPTITQTISPVDINEGCYVVNNLGNITMNYLCLSSHYSSNSYSYDLSNYLTNIPLSCQRNPYVNIKVGTYKESISINLLDFFREDSEMSNNMILSCEVFTSYSYPFTTHFIFRFNGKTIQDKNIVFNCNSSDTVPYDVSAWNNYYANNMASVNDGLRTKHYYDSEIINNNRIKGEVSGAINFATSLGSSALGSYDSEEGFNAFKFGSKAVQSVGTWATSILNTEYAYTNSKIGLEQEKALQKLGWNDYKSAPSQATNLNSSITMSLSQWCPTWYIDLYIAKNIEEIVAFHKKFGYQINKSVELYNDMFDFTLQEHSDYDYIQYDNFNTTLSLPINIKNMIDNIFNNGFRLWWRDDNFRNLNCDNNEV